MESSTPSCFLLLLPMEFSSPSLAHPSSLWQDDGQRIKVMIRMRKMRRTTTKSCKRRCSSAVFGLPRLLQSLSITSMPNTEEPFQRANLATSSRTPKGFAIFRVIGVRNWMNPPVMGKMCPFEPACTSSRMRMDQARPN